MAGEQPKRGTCQFCGCTDAHACAEGCWWIDEEHTVCSAAACVDKFFGEHRQRVDQIMQAIAAGVE